jgi:hypothetical protein
MSLIDKAYFTLEELEERWHLPHRDLVYLAENGLLRVSIRLFGVRVEFGAYEQTAEGEWFRVPHERSRFTGFQDLLERDVFRLFRQDKVDIERFHAPEPEYRDLIEPTETVSICREDLLVRREERDRVEAKHALVRKGSPGSPASLQQANDYREVRSAGLTFNLGPLQARVVKLLDMALNSSTPWCEGKLILGQAGSSSTRMADVFKSQSHWRRLIDSDGRGRYRLRLPQR